MGCAAAGEGVRVSGGGTPAGGRCFSFGELCSLPYPLLRAAISHDVLGETQIEYKRKAAGGHFEKHLARHSQRFLPLYHLCILMSFLTNILAFFLSLIQAVRSSWFLLMRLSIYSLLLGYSCSMSVGLVFLTDQSFRAGL